MSQIDFPQNYNASEVLFSNLEEDRIAITCEGKDVNYKELKVQSNQAGNLFKNLNIPPRSVIVMLLESRPIFPITFFGGVKAGYIMAIVAPHLKPEEYQFLFNENHAKAIVVDAKLYFKIKTIECPELKHVIVYGADIDKTHNFEKLMSESSPELSTAPTTESDPAFIIYTSGTTGHPKGVVHLHRSIPYSIENFGKHVLEIRTDDIMLCLSKLFFAFGFNNSLSIPFSVGARTLLIPEWFTADMAFDLIEKYRPTIFCAVSSFYRSLLTSLHAKTRDLSSIRLFISSGEKLPLAIFKEWYESYGIEIVECLGSTEMLTAYVSNFSGEVHPGSSGRTVPGYEIKLVDQEEREVKRGESGIMMVRGGSSAAFYLNHPEKTKATMRGNWIFSNDKFHQDEEGYFYYEGRSDDMFKVSGQWVSPIEVEHVLLDHPAVKECLVRGMRDQSDLIKLEALVVLHQNFLSIDKAELQNFLKAKLAPYKCPQEIRFVDELPKTATGKLKRA